jgi:hypothetical protein
MNKEQTIQQQKDIADELLGLLEIVDPSLILAGGAPRNWFFGETAKDLDIYLYIPYGYTAANDAKRWKALGLDLKVMHSTSEEQRKSTYACLKSLSRIWEGTYRGMDVQLMIMNEPTYDCVVSKFGTSICKFWYKYGRINTTLEALVGISLKRIYKADDYTAKVKHVNKMLKYYPDYELQDYSVAFEKDVEGLRACLNIDSDRSLFRHLWKVLGGASK